MSAMPEFIEPMLATLVPRPFDDPDFLFEIKWDGFRVQAVVSDGVVRTWTRGRQDAEGYFGPFLVPPTWIDASEAIVDGEVIALDAAGEPSFAFLGDPRGHLLYQVFDLLWVDGKSLLDWPLEERKALLQARLRSDPRVRFTEHVVGEGLAFHAAAVERGLEGIVAKDRRSPYVPGLRSRAWRKVKIRPEQELVVGGWTRGIGPAAELAALHVGVHRTAASATRARSVRGSRARTAPSCSRPCDHSSPTSRRSRRLPPRRLAAGSTWVRPELVIRAEFAGWVGDGKVRQASYKGIDRGKDPRSVVREAPS